MWLQKVAFYTIILRFQTPVFIVIQELKTSNAVALLIRHFQYTTIKKLMDQYCNNCCIKWHQDS